MKEFIDFSQNGAQEHKDINSYGVSCMVSRETTVSPNEAREFAAQLVKAVSESCLRCGAIDIGHIKAYMEYKNGFLYADTVGESSEVTVEGRDGDPANTIRLSLNSVVCGISSDDVKNATEETMKSVFSRFGLVRKPEIEKKQE